MQNRKKNNIVKKSKKKHVSNKYKMIGIKPVTSEHDKICYIETPKTADTDFEAQKIQASYVQSAKRIITKTTKSERIDLMKYATLKKDSCSGFEIIVNGIITDYKIKENKLESIMLSSPLVVNSDGEAKEFDSHVWLKINNFKGLCPGTDFDYGDSYSIEVFLGQEINIHADLESYKNHTRYGIGDWYIITYPKLNYLKKGKPLSVPDTCKLEGYLFSYSCKNTGKKNGEEYIYKNKLTTDEKRTVDGMQYLLNMKVNPKYCETIKLIEE